LHHLRECVCVCVWGGVGGGWGGGGGERGREVRRIRGGSAQLVCPGRQPCS
jgi:hypothetical protein